MIGFAIRLAITALGLWLAQQVVPGIQIAGTGTLVAAALLLGIVNAVVRPLVLLFTLPITVLTLGLFLLVLNAGMVALVAWVVPGFTIAGFWTAVGTAIIVSLVSWAASGLIGPSGKFERFDTRH